MSLLLLLLGLLRSFGTRSSTRSSFSLVSYLTIRLSVRGFCGGRPGTSFAREPPPGLPRWPGVLALFLCRFSDFDDDRTAVELGVVQSLDGLLGGLDGGESNETVTSRAKSVTRSALDDLSAEAVD